MYAPTTERDFFVCLGDGRQIEMGIGTGREQIADRVILVQSLLDGDDLAAGLVVEAGKKRPLDVGFRAGALPCFDLVGRPIAAFDLRPRGALSDP